MKQREITSAFFWLIVGLILTIWSATYPLGNFTQPGTGFLPLGLGILLLVFSAVLLVKAFRLTARKAGETLPSFPRWKNILFIVAVLMAAIFLFERIGYLVTFFVLALVLPVLAGRATWKRSLLFAVLAAAGIYIVFVWLLKQPLPQGLLGV